MAVFIAMKFLLWVSCNYNTSTISFVLELHNIPCYLIVFGFESMGIICAFVIILINLQQREEGVGETKQKQNKMNKI